MKAPRPITTDHKMSRISADPHGTSKRDHAHGDHGKTADQTHDTVPPDHSGPVYTCPMHPQVRQSKPGSYPICGMGLERETAAAGDEGPNPELINFTRRFWVGVALTLPLLVLTMSAAAGFTAIRDFFGERTTLWVEFAL